MESFYILGVGRKLSLLMQLLVNEKWLLKMFAAQQTAAAFAILDLGTGSPPCLAFAIVNIGKYFVSSPSA